MGNSTSVTIQIAFRSECYNVQVTAIDTGTGEMSLNGSASTTSVSVRNSSSGTISNFYWFAVGV
jgi:hypothetical protein